MKRIIIAISGASGVIYGIELLKELVKRDIEVHLVISESGKRNIAIDTDYSVGDLESMAHGVHDNSDLGAPLASGSFLTDGMVVAPCTIKTLSGIANSYSDNLIVRTADVTLKEKRKLVLLVRETPLHKGYL
jgi:4-hydroxy-3-polyprenylbenzoate decarboxylase